jgi:hypothetical protein
MLLTSTHHFGLVWFGLVWFFKKATTKNTACGDACSRTSAEHFG